MQAFKVFATPLGSLDLGSLKATMAAEIVKKLADEKLPHTTLNARRLFGSFSCIPKPPPLARLPNELLSEIFIFALQNAEDRSQMISAPMVISQVSVRWRNVAIATGALWTTIVITFPTSRQQLSLVITWLKRSRLAPLDIFLDFRDPSWDWDLAESLHKFRWQDMEAILRLLMPHVSRWKCFELLTDTWAPIFTFLCYTRRVKSLPALKSLSLHRCNAFLASKNATFHPVEMKKPIQLFGGHVAEQLRTVTMTGVHVDWVSSSLRNLRKLEFRYLASDVTPTMDEFTDISKACQNLRYLTIMGRGPRIDDTPSGGHSFLRDKGPDGFSLKAAPQAIELPHVTNFIFGFLDTDYAVKLLDKLLFPSLKELTVEGLAVLDALTLRDVDATPILERITPSRDPHQESNLHYPFPMSSIHSLKLIAIASNTVTFSRLFNELHELNFLGIYRTDNALDALVLPFSDSSSSKPTPCATLTRLECYDVDPTILHDVVLSRLKSSQLADVSLRSDEIDVENLRRLCNVGVEVLNDFSGGEDPHHDPR
ncbi:hypothetical protein H0H92_009045 [Tricholoma furcatifolium]|nr:hypothetical protein H0H92_009045 [Tricholoma furcatifolium]